MSDDVIYYGTPVGVFNEGNDVRLDLTSEVNFTLVDPHQDRPTSRFIIKRLDAIDYRGEIRADDIVGIFTEDDQFRLDIGEFVFPQKVAANHVTQTTVLTIEKLEGKSAGPVHYGEVVGIFSSDHIYRLDIESPPLKAKMSAHHDSWATRLRVRAVPPLDQSPPVDPPLPPEQPDPPPPSPPGPSPKDGGASHAPLTTLERIFVGVYEGVKRAQVDVQRGAQRKFDWFFPQNQDKQREARTVDVPIALADGTTEIRKIPLFALVPHHDLMIDAVTVKMKVDLLELTRSTTSPEINEIDATMARAGAAPALFADIEIHLKGTEPVEGVARLNDEIIKRF